MNGKKRSRNEFPVNHIVDQFAGENLPRFRICHKHPVKLRVIHFFHFHGREHKNLQKNQDPQGHKKKPHRPVFIRLCVLGRLIARFFLRNLIFHEMI